MERIRQQQQQIESAEQATPTPHFFLGYLPPYIQVPPKSFQIPLMNIYFNSNVKTNFLHSDKRNKKTPLNQDTQQIPPLYLYPGSRGLQFIIRRIISVARTFEMKDDQIFYDNQDCQVTVRDMNTLQHGNALSTAMFNLGVQILSDNIIGDQRQKLDLTILPASFMQKLIQSEKQLAKFNNLILIIATRCAYYLELVQQWYVYASAQKAIRAIRKQQIG
ncbi:MAG: hypothetical protein EZS28_022203 [Streblomastix strix]|uniref:Uncharacterized protein n=1 Tax=Streblomastix strix TaxID=222440 RepID=A0A5J4VIE1_9EUKA|nr:MAG: hypothetical protein EZS28_022203 [Streblomastix strix]